MYLIELYIYLVFAGRNYDCIEVPAAHIYCLDLNNRKIRLIPWDNDRETAVWSIETWLENIRLQQSLPDDQFSFDFDESIDLRNHVILLFKEIENT